MWRTPPIASYSIEAQPSPGGTIELVDVALQFSWPDHPEDSID